MDRNTECDIFMPVHFRYWPAESFPGVTPCAAGAIVRDIVRVNVRRPQCIHWCPETKTTVDERGSCHCTRPIVVICLARSAYQQGHATVSVVRWRISSLFQSGCNSTYRIDLLLYPALNSARLYGLIFHEQWVHPYHVLWIGKEPNLRTFGWQKFTTLLLWSSKEDIGMVLRQYGIHALRFFMHIKKEHFLL